MVQDQQWYFAEGDQQVGPVSRQDLEEAFQIGRIQANRWSGPSISKIGCRL